MGTYNSIRVASLICPWCQALIIDGVVECRFGYTSEMKELTIGETYPWASRREPQNGGRPEGGSVDGEGYAECPACRRDFFLHVLIEEDRITRVRPDPTRDGYIQG
jgi:hypothetical protein